MRFLVVGAGGIGCYYGARLQAAGHEVVFVARGEHLRVMQQQGLQVEHAELHFSQPVVALSEAEVLARYTADEFDLILLCFKAFDTLDWLVRMTDWLETATTPVLSLQNGVDNEPLIAAQIGAERTLGGLAVRIGGHITAPGCVVAAGPAQIIMGFWPQADTTLGDRDSWLHRLNSVFIEAGIPARVTSDIAHELWRKLLINNGVNPLSALTGLTTRELVQDPYFGPSVRQMMIETAAVAQVDSVNLNDKDIDEMIALLNDFDAIKTSMLVDHEKGKPLELEAICGAIIRRGEQVGIDTPVNRLVYALLNQSG
jgi:2-dehydropantoate 2-reductase